MADRDVLASREERATGLSEELKQIVRLAGPVFVTQLGSMLMGTVDVIMVGRLGADSLAATSLGNTYAWTISIVGVGAVMPTAALIARASGSGDQVAIQRSVQHALAIALLMVVPLAPALYFAEAALAFLGGGRLATGLVREAGEYSRVLAYGLPGYFLFFALHYALLGRSSPRLALWAMAAGNVVNLAGNWVLIYGNLGAPALGALGSAWATTLTRYVMCAALVLLALRDPIIRGALRLNLFRGLWDRSFGRALGLGVPLGLRTALDIGVWSVVIFLAAPFGAVAVASSQLAMSGLLLAAMVGTALCAAASVRVGFFAGARDSAGVRRAARAALAAGAIGLLPLTAAGALFPAAVARIYTNDPLVLAAAIPMIRLAFLLLAIDSAAVIAAGILQGLLDVRVPSLAIVGASWGLCVPLGYGLASAGGFGALGLWLGLCLGTLPLTGWLLARAHRKVRSPPGDGGQPPQREVATAFTSS